MKSKLNLLIVHTDQQRFDSLGVNGSYFPHTPNIDKFAEEACNFTSHYSSNPICSPSRASLLTGLTVTGHGVSSNGYPLFNLNGIEMDEFSKRFFGENGNSVNVRDKIPTLADILADEGYATTLIGKLHLQPHKAAKEFGFEESPSRWRAGEMEGWNGPLLGFQHVRLIQSHGEYNCALYEGGHYAKWLYENHRDIYDAVNCGPKPGNCYASKMPSEFSNSQYIADEFISFLDARDKEQPFFTFLGFPDPHIPFTPPFDVAKLYEDAPVPGGDYLTEEQLSKKATVKRDLIEKERKDDEYIKDAQRKTLAMEKNVDVAFGRVLKALKERGLYDNTIVIFTSDHGDFMGDYGLVSKQVASHNCLIHTPFIMKAAAGEELPKEFSSPIANYDVLPTVLRMLDVKVPKHVQGTDIFDGTEKTPFIACHRLDSRENSFGIVCGDYHYVYYPLVGEEELYDRIRDPKEKENLIGKEEFESVRKDCKLRLLEAHAKYDERHFGAVSIW